MNDSPISQIDQLDDLNQLLAVTTDPNKVHAILTALWSESELDTALKRIAIARSLAQGLSYDEITKELKVSSATIASVAGQTEATGWQLLLGLQKQMHLLKRRFSFIFQ